MLNIDNILVFLWGQCGTLVFNASLWLPRERVVNDGDFLIDGSVGHSKSWTYMHNLSKCMDMNGPIRTAYESVCSAWAVQIFLLMSSHSPCISTWSTTLEKQRDALYWAYINNLEKMQNRVEQNYNISIRWYETRYSLSFWISWIRLWCDFFFFLPHCPT